MFVLKSHTVIYLGNRCQALGLRVEVPPRPYPRTDPQNNPRRLALKVCSSVCLRCNLCRPKILLMEWWRVVVGYSWVQHGAAPVASKRGQSRHAAREGSKTLCTKASRMNSLRTMLGPLQYLGGWEKRRSWPCEESIKSGLRPLWLIFGDTLSRALQFMFHHKVSECKKP